MLKKVRERLNIALEISVSVERKGPSRKDTRLSGARRYFKFTVLNWRNMYELRDLADEVISIFYEQKLTRVEKNLEEK